MSSGIRPSSISVFRECPARWWYEHVAGVREAPTAASALGTRSHAVLSQLWEGRPTHPTQQPEALILGTAAYRAAKELMPQGAKSEARVRWYGMKGSADLAAPGEAIFDLKTTSNPKAYGLTEEQLHRDPQALVYAAAVDARVAHWVYFSTKVQLPKPHVVTVRWDDEAEFQELLDGIKHTVDYMREVATLAEPPPSAVEAVGEEQMPLPICEKWMVHCPAMVQCWRAREEKRTRSLDIVSG